MLNPASLVLLLCFAGCAFALSCPANTYFTGSSCASCPAGSFSLAGATHSSSCRPVRFLGPTDTSFAVSCDMAESLSGLGIYTVAGTPAFATDRFGTPDAAMYFNGALLLSLPLNPLPMWGTAPNFTVSLFLKSNVRSDYPITWGRCCCTLQSGITNSYDDGYLGAVRLDELRFYSQSNPSVKMVDVFNNTWHHIAVVQNGAVGTRVYFDGVFAGSTSASSLDQWDFAYLGRHCDPSGPKFTGAMDDLRFFARSLSEIEVNAIIAAPSPTSTSTPTASSTSTSTSTASPTRSSSSTATATASSTSTSTTTPTSSSSSTASATASSTSTSTTTPTSSSSSAASATASSTSTSTTTPTSSSSSTASATASATATSSPSSTVTPTSSATATATRPATPSSTPKPPKWVSFFITYGGNDPGALARSSAFVCAFRDAFAQLTSVPLSAVQLVALKTEAGMPFRVLVSQLGGSCGSSRQLSLELSGRRIQSLSPLSVKVAVDVSQTALTSSSSNAEQVVRGEIETAFSQNPSLVNSLFVAATTAACSAQGIPSNLCPNPPSLVMSLSLSNSGYTTPAQTETGNVLVAAVTSAIGGAVFAAAVFALLLWWRAKSSRSIPYSPAGTPGLVIRQLAAVPSAPPADDPGFVGSPSSKRFVVPLVTYMPTHVNQRTPALAPPPTEL